MAVSLLSGIVFGRSYGDEVVVAGVRFVVVFAMLLGLSYVQPSAAE